MKSAVVILATILTATSTFYAGQRAPKRTIGRLSAPSDAERRAWNDIRGRFNKYSDFLSGNLWALIHVYESKSEMEKSLKLFDSLARTLSSNDPGSMKKFDRPGGFKSQLVQTLNSKDDTVSGFAAVLLAIIGDPKYAPHIAALLTRNSHLPPDTYPPITVRGRAAVALGMLGTKQYVPQIANLLRSKNGYDRSGAATALGYLHATEHAKAIADLLASDEVGSRDDSSAIHSLFEMGVAQKYKKEIARLLDEEVPGENTVAAAYALARLGAKEHATDIAKLLRNKFNKGDGAKALALLGAKEYVDEIVALLHNQDSSDREDAALALGILGAKEHAPALARLLKDKDASIQRAAALSLILMEASDYIKEALPIIARQKEGPYFHAETFNPVVDQEARHLDERFKALLARIKGSSAGP